MLPFCIDPVEGGRHKECGNDRGREVQVWRVVGQGERRWWCQCSVKICLNAATTWTRDVAQPQHILSTTKHHQASGGCTTRVVCVWPTFKHISDDYNGIYMTAMATATAVERAKETIGRVIRGVCVMSSAVCSMYLLFAFVQVCVCVEMFNRAIK